MIYMIRHGQACFGHDEYDRLSPLGTKQARVLAGRLLDTQFRPDAIYSGTLLRQTAPAQEVISAAAFPDMVKDDPSFEDDLPRMHTDKDSFKRIFEAAMFRWVAGPFDAPGVESWHDFRARVARSLRCIMKKHGRGKTIAVFTSGGPIAASLSEVLGIPGEKALWLNWQIINTSMTRYMYRQEQITLAGFNSIAHLELAGDPTLITYR
jgi:broad specificity phosphatase PhoE